MASPTSPRMPSLAAQTFPALLSLSLSAASGTMRSATAAAWLASISRATALPQTQQSSPALMPQSTIYRMLAVGIARLGDAQPSSGIYEPVPRDLDLLTISSASRSQALTTS